MLVVLPDELEILRDMQRLDRDVFYYLAHRTDFDTGVIGSVTKISYGGMALDLSERDQPGRDKSNLHKVTSKQIENCVSRLVASGLLVRESRSGFHSPLLLKRFFWESVWGLGSCDQKQVGSRLGVQLGAFSRFLFNRIKSFNVNLDSGRESYSLEVGTTSNNIIINNKGDEYSMFLDWQPMSELETILTMSGYQIAKVDPAWIPSFKAYWWQRQERKYTDRGWTQKLALWLVGEFRNSTAKAQPVKKNTGHLPGYGPLPERFKIPREDDHLVSWMRKWGYGEPQQGISYQQLRNQLRAVITNKIEDWKRSLS
ncbi:MAG: DnaT-like ssDNA-binding domain-containing protein [Methylobacter sp.]|uniref:DnaT-like ssDNA-binding domain-containing protein n=1 Tax=Methylobacter sp. TaxID=2051955 RepID=UPI0025EA12AC|nr:DnaT-like ssDNA-binding domain-containing protein [Methylobacter sp.]MCK9622226.1 DnaT-like ssDNA-binding domain-containing protein [Methylobacter sp.]